MNCDGNCFTVKFSFILTSESCRSKVIALLDHLLSLSGRTKRDWRRRPVALDSEVFNRLSVFSFGTPLCAHVIAHCCAYCSVLCTSHARKTMHSNY